MYSPLYTLYSNDNKNSLFTPRRHRLSSLNIGFVPLLVLLINICSS